ncbi:MAG: amidohydrolase family protein [Gemmatimonadota bacterium]
MHLALPTALIVLVASAGLSPAALTAQRASTFQPEVREYIAVDAPVIALVHVRIIDGTGAAPQSDQTVLIAGNRIQGVGAAGTVQVPAGAQVIDLTGHTVIPGLVGVHDHMFYTTPGSTGVQSSYAHPRLYLASGVTTVRTTGSFSPYAELNLKGGIDRGEVPGPRMHITAPYLITPGGDPHLDQLGMHKIATEEEARRVVRYWAEEGAEWIKGYTQLSRPIFAAVIDEAHKRGLKVTGHLCSISFSEAVRLGIDNIEHGYRTNSDYDVNKQPDRCPPTHFETLAKMSMSDPRIQETFRLMISHGVAMTTTAVNEQLAPGRPGPDQRTLEAMAPWIAEQEVARRAALDAAKPGSEIYPKMGEIYPLSQQYEMAFVKAGGTLAAGVDPAFAALAGFGDQRNLELLVQAGFTVPQAIQIMTANGANVLGVIAQLGTVEAGKLADLVVIRGDLMADPSAIRQTVTVFKDGIGYDSAKLIASVKGQVGVR